MLGQLMVCAAVLPVTAMKNKNQKIIFFIFTHLMILLIGLSRLILNVHFLSDILVGYIIGIFGLLCGVLVYTKLDDKKSTK